MRRHLLGLIALLFLAGWGLLLPIERPFEAAVCMRVGLVLSALWLALPQLTQIKLPIPPWLLGTLVIGGLLIAVRPRAALWVLPIAAALAFLQFVGWLFKPLPPRK